jgi:carboxyl-terminal processing protease
MWRQGVLLLCLMLWSTGCGSLFLGEDPPDDPESVFEAFWKSYDRHYAHFDLKGIDWDEAYEKYRPMVSSETSEEELFEILAQMLVILEDGHVYLVGEDRKAFSHAEIRASRANFNISVVEEEFLGQSLKRTGDGKITYGRIDDDLGYIRLSTLSGGDGIGDDLTGWIEDFDIALAALRDTEGLVLDLRNNGGGRAYNTKYVASRFATERRPFLVTRTRNGPAHDDFSAPNRWYAEPREKAPYTRPVVVLTNRRSFSAAEWLTLALRQYEHVRHLGTHSGGGLAMFLPRELPNGWMHTISVQDTRCPEGRSYERVGVAPHRYVENADSDRDAILEEAIKDLRSRQ